MSEHLCETYTPGCFRCELNRDEENDMSVTVTLEKNPFMSYCTAGEPRHRLEKPNQAFVILVESGKSATRVTLCRDHMEVLMREAATAFSVADGEEAKP